MQLPKQVKLIWFWPSPRLPILGQGVWGTQTQTPWLGRMLTMLLKSEVTGDKKVSMWQFMETGMFGIWACATFLK